MAFRCAALLARAQRSSLCRELGKVFSTSSKPACTASQSRGTVAMAIGRTLGRSFFSCLIVV